MANESVQRGETRREMGFAFIEIARNLRLLQERLALASPSMAAHVGQCAALCDRMVQEAAGQRSITDVQLRTLSRLSEKLALKIGELVDVLDELEENPANRSHPVALAMALQHASAKIAKVSEMTNDATRILDLRLS